MLIEDKKNVSILDYHFYNINHDSVQDISKKLQKGLKKFTLVGSNWLERNSKKPIVLLIGINYWKRGFISDYLPEYRCVFASNKTMFGFKLIFQLFKSGLNPTVFFIWGYTESSLIRWYAKLKKIPINRIEDGFIRSANLGLSRCTPYSLIFDKKGLHYNAKTSSDIENLLNNYDFDYDHTIIKDAEEALKMILNLNISKYNLPYVKHFTYHANLRKQILVIGQVKSDMSLKLGNPNNYNTEDLLNLARIENPEADILYRPHPDIYYKCKKSVSNVGKLQFVKIIKPEIPLVDILYKVDQVYTITSLSGVEAILRNIKVTVVGTPFYAGWGLTDDRVSFRRRRRKLTKIQLFTISYLKYPRYLANIEDSKIGLMSACLVINADREILYSDKISDMKVTTAQDIKLIAQSKYWPKLFNINTLSNTSSLVLKNLKFVNFLNIFQNLHGKYAQLAIVCYVFGNIDIKNICNILYIIRPYLHKEVLSIILIELWKYYRDPVILSHYEWCFNESESNKLLTKKISGALSKEASVEFYNDATQAKYSAANIYMERKDFDKAVKELCQICLCGSPSLDIMHIFINIANLKFEFTSSVEIADFCNLVDISFSSGKSNQIIAYNLKFSKYFSKQKFFLAIIHSYLFSPSSLQLLISIINNCRPVDQNKNDIALLLAMIKLKNTISLPQSLAFLSLGEYEKAIQICHQLILEKKDVTNTMLTLSKIYRNQGQYNLAYDVITQLQDCNSITYYSELLKVLIQSQRFSEAKNILDEALNKKIELSQAIMMNVFLSNKMIEEAFKCYPCMDFSNTIANYFKDKYKYFENLSEKNSIKNILLLSSYGLSDEIRFASLYNDFVRYFGFTNVKISCDSRLLELFQRSFIKINFVPIRRTRPYNQGNYFPEFYTNLPGSELHTVLDNNGLEEIRKSNYISLVSDLIWHFRKNRNDFPRVAYLKADPNKVILYKNKLKNKLQKGCKLVGLNWSNSLNTCSRRIHYLSIEELEPIFQIDNIQFVNFQYFKCNEELKWLEEHYPNKMINFAGIDQYNDFDSVAALMNCMDLIIAPCTSVVELAGALGCKAWLLSNSSELHWRKINKEKIDIWHNNITHVEGKIFGNKFSLVKELTKRLKEYLLT
ncbi:MAG: hypothetical protein AB8B68_04100 [Rickettsiaceae bacterium]